MVESQVGGRPRLCRLVIWSDFDGYGFNLHAEKSRPGQYVGKVDEGSPAAAAGLQEGDRIVEVNGVNIAKENHKQVVQRIKSIPREAELLVVDLETDRVYRERDEPITSADAIRTTAERKQQLPPSDSYPDEDEDRRSTASIVSNASSFAEKNDEENVRSDAEEVPRIEVTVESPMIVVENFDEKNEGLVVEVIEPDGKENEDSDKNDQSLRVEEVEEHEDDDIDNLNVGEDEKEDKRREKQPSPPPLSGRDMGSAGNSPSPRSTPSPDIPEQRDDDFSKGSNGLNLNMTAAEMREKICSKKKRDPRKDDRMDIRRKYEIVQTL